MLWLLRNRGRNAMHDDHADADQGLAAQFGDPSNRRPLALGSSVIDGLDADEISRRLQDYAELAEGAFAANTVRAIRSDLAIWSEWCVAGGEPEISDRPDQFVRFLRAMAPGRAPATMSRYISSLSHLNRAAQIPHPSGMKEVALFLRALKRQTRRAPRQAAPLTADLVDRMVAAQPHSPLGLRNRALILTMRDMLARRSEVAALDLAHASPEDGLVYLAFSKTDQEGDGAWLYIAPETGRAIRSWIEAVGLAEGPLFRPLSKAGRPRDNKNGGRLYGNDISRILQESAARAGIMAKDFGPTPGGGPRRVSGHSLRTGMAVELTRDGAALPALMQAGRWKSSSMPARYAATASAAHGAVAAWQRKRQSSDD